MRSVSLAKRPDPLVSSSVTEAVLLSALALARPITIALLLSSAAGAQAVRTAKRAVPGPTTITIVAYNHFYEAPNPINSGLVTFRFINRGPDLHQMWIVKIDEGYAFSDFMNAIRPGRPIPAWLHGLGGPESPESGEEVSVTLNLEPGRYALACFIPSEGGGSHLSKGMFLPLTVRDAKGPVLPSPKSDGSIVLRDGGAEVNGAVNAGRHLLRVENQGKETRGMRVARLLDGKTMDDVTSWLASGGAPASAPVKLLGGVTPLATGEANWLSLMLSKGDYVLLPMAFAFGTGEPQYLAALATKFSVQ